ncbi:MAG: type I-B CRISPR-associated protein Cas7/Csh2 [Bacteroidota bacterium]|nr:type I-B CRISPR-associated protein Cas7/Csh2 [Bacteroidota bacterium]
MENLPKQSELLFVWDAKLCNPNGDMSADNAPRFDEVDEKAIVSDVRIKRTIRDDLQYRKEKMIFINNDEILEHGYTAEERFKSIDGYDPKKNADNRSVFLKCIDNRLFGGVAPKSNIQLVGAVQFSWTKSLNKTETILKSGTGAFATKGKDGEAKFTKTFRADNYIPYGIFGMYGTINRMQAKKAQTTEDDILEMLDSLWMGTKFLNTRSKEGQKSRMMIRVVYKEDSKYFIGLLDELIGLKNDDSSMIRNINEVELDFSRLIKVLDNAKNEIEKVVIVLDESMGKYKEELNQINNVEFIHELNIIQ